MLPFLMFQQITKNSLKMSVLKSTDMISVKNTRVWIKERKSLKTAQRGPNTCVDYQGYDSEKRDKNHFWTRWELVHFERGHSALWWSAQLAQEKN